MSKTKEKTLTDETNPDSVQKAIKPAQKVRKKSTSERLKSAKAKRKRPPLYNPNRFGVQQKSGYHYRIVSDKEYEYCVGRGYEDDPDYTHTKRTQDPSQIGSATVSLGGGEYGTVMRQRQEDYDEDQRMKHDHDKKCQGDLLNPINKNPSISANLEVKDVNFAEL